MPTNQQIHLVSRPSAEAVAGNFQLIVSETPALQDGQVLVRHHFLSLDPYMRGRMNDAKSYTAPQALNEVMGGGTVGEVVESRNPKFVVGDQVVGMGGWQQYSVVNADQLGALRKVDTRHIPLSAYLGAVGMPGVTAWYGLVKIIEPKAGETMVVSAPRAPWAVPLLPCRKPVVVAPSALRVVPKNAGTRLTNWVLTPASTTSCTRTRPRCPKPSRTPARTASMAILKTSVAWCSTPCCSA